MNKFKFLNISIICSATFDNFGIGLNGNMPWNLPKDLQYFKFITSKTKNLNKKNAILMGKNTFLSIKKPLKKRINIILSKDIEFKKEIKEKFKDDEIFIFENLENALNFLNLNKKKFEKIFVIGGQSVFNEIFEKDLCEKIYLTKIYKQIKCDRFLKKFSNEKYEEETDYSFLGNKFSKEIQNENDICYQFFVYKLKHEEYQYLNLIKRILKEGEERIDRTGIETFSIFGNQMRFNLRNNIFPLLTSKGVFFKGVVEELLWFLKGKTNSFDLASKGVNIWNDNTSREFLDKIGLKNHEIGDAGPIYGFQWRHWGADYKGMNEDYSNKGIDQINEIINQLKKEPFSRRIILSSWNVSDLKKMSLPPCHILSQFYVNTKNELSCSLTQRSCDLGLGVPFNIASYSLLTYVIAQITKLKPCELIYNLNDAHIYKNHVKELKIQIKRIPRPFPKLFLNEKIENIEDFKFEDFKLIDYFPHKKIKMKMTI